MNAGLPQPAHDPHRFYSEFVAQVQKYRAALLAENIKETIHAVAANTAVSQQVITKIQSELRGARRMFFSFGTISATIFLVASIISYSTEFVTKNIYRIPWNDNYLGMHTDVIMVVMLLVWMLTAEVFLIKYFQWRSYYSDAYIANYLIKALEIGLMYQNAPTDVHLRDRFATSIQLAAIRYPIIYKRSGSSRFFAAQVRSQAKSCRNDIMSIVPSLVTASQCEIEVINSNLTRLLIRSQTGYWYQTSDIAKQGMPMPRRNAIRISLSSFIKDRTIQVAIIALPVTFLATTGSFIVTHLIKG